MQSTPQQPQAPRRCVYTVLLGGYERLNEQPAAKASGIPFICFSDDPSLTSETWEVRPAPLLFPADPVRSQRALKLRPHLLLPEFDGSLYVDNTVILEAPFQALFDRYLGRAPLSVPGHSFRASVRDEFTAVAAAGYDDGRRLAEQLRHYDETCPAVLGEAPFWTGMLLRDHRSAPVRQAMELWLMHVLRYSRRDQLSLNAALAQTGLEAERIDIDNHVSAFHSWPHKQDRVQRPVTKATDRIGELEDELDALRLQAGRLGRQLDAVYASHSWRIGQAAVRLLSPLRALIRRRGE